MSPKLPEGLSRLDALLVELSFAGSGEVQRTEQQRDPACRDLANSLQRMSSTLAQDPDQSARLLRAAHECLEHTRVKPQPAVQADRADKRVVAYVLLVFSRVSATALARAMGVALSTVYAYAEDGRPNRPGPKRLFQAAYMVRLCARELDQLADSLAKTARRTPPNERGPRGRTLPVID